MIMKLSIHLSGTGSYGYFMTEQEHPSHYRSLFDRIDINPGAPNTLMVPSFSMLLPHAVVSTIPCRPTEWCPVLPVCAQSSYTTT